jgi:hypothetical protein
MAGDLWEELSGYDGRFARTFRRLFGRPGALTVDVLEGRRASYVTPLRLYLVASVAYFLVAALVPPLRKPPTAAIPGSKTNIDLMSDDRNRMTPEQQAEVLKSIERAPWGFKYVLRPLVLDPRGVRSRLLENLPRMFAVIVPLFAAILSLFYWRRPFAQHLVFALHVHAIVFSVMALERFIELPRSFIVAGVAQGAGLLFIAWYWFLAIRRVYGGSWTVIGLKSVGIGTLYMVVGVTGLLGTLVWSALH